MKQLIAVLATLIISAFLTFPTEAQSIEQQPTQTFYVTVVGDITTVDRNGEKPGGLTAYFIGEHRDSDSGSVTGISYFKVIFSEEIPEKQLFALKLSKQNSQRILIDANVDPREVISVNNVISIRYATQRKI